MPETNQEKTPLRGILHLFSETGTEGGYWAFQDDRFITADHWSYDGLHILVDGDELRIFSKEDPREVVWSGKISLQQFPLFTENAYGFWIHADQVGIDRPTWSRWFFEQNPAELIPVNQNPLWPVEGPS